MWQVKLPAVFPFSSAISDSADKSFPDIPFNWQLAIDLDLQKKENELGLSRVVFSAGH